MELYAGLKLHSRNTYYQAMEYSKAHLIREIKKKRLKQGRSQESCGRHWTISRIGSVSHGVNDFFTEGLGGKFDGEGQRRIGFFQGP